jgi:hypothetical protein
MLLVDMPRLSTHVIEGAGTRSDTRRSALWAAGIAALVLAYLVAANITQTLPLGGGVTITICGALWSPVDWFIKGCGQSLPVRLLILFAGGATLALCALFARRGNASPNSPDDADGHEVSFEPGTALWKCTDPGCGAEGTTRFGATRHQRKTGTRISLNAEATAPVTAGQRPGATAASEFKTCPDCAEQVRAAARKCRFCGYMFTGAPEDS